MWPPLFRGSIVLVLFACLVGCGEPAGDVGFSHSVIDPSPSSGEECCTDVLMIGDLDGDGLQDVVVGSEKAVGDGLVWYRFPTWERLPIARGEFTTDGQLADMDADGDLDVVVGTLANGSGEILWFENRLRDGVTEWPLHRVGPGYAHDIVVGDMDGDGRLDVLSGDKKGVTLWRRSGDAFERVRISDREGEGIAVADIDADGELDVVYGASWLANPGKPVAARWEFHPIDPQWTADTRAVVADMNGDGRPDVVLSASEGRGALAWFEAPSDPRSPSWVRHAIDEGSLEGVHSLQVADVDLDGRLDVIAAEMHTSPQKRVFVYRNRGAQFDRSILARTGSHNMRVADLDADGDVDLVGKNYAGRGRAIALWDNVAIDGKWKYISVDADRPKSQRESMGLAFVDLGSSGSKGIAAGGYVYKSRGQDAGWERVVVDAGADIHFGMDVDGSGSSDLIGFRDDAVVWFRADNEARDRWTATVVARVPRGRTQGVVMGNFSGSKRPDLVFTRGQTLWLMQIPDDPRSGSWPVHMISRQVEEAGIASADFDGDGDLDIAAVAADGQRVVWLENPGRLGMEWPANVVGERMGAKKGGWLDRIAATDLNGDGRPEIVATEERQDRQREAGVYLFSRPEGAVRGAWTRRVIARMRSVNSMDIGDVDGDGRPDIVVAEHTDIGGPAAPDNLTLALLNRDNGRQWVAEIIERGPNSSHLGARLVDVDGDGTPEVVSIAWSDYQHVHMWARRQAGVGRPAKQRRRRWPVRAKTQYSKGITTWLPT